MEGKIYLDGKEIKRSESLDIDDKDNIWDIPSHKGELNLTLSFAPNYLYARKLITGIPKRIYIPPFI